VLRERTATIAHDLAESLSPLFKAGKGKHDPLQYVEVAAHVTVTVTVTELRPAVDR
jgi:hypothetical protein